MVTSVSDYTLSYTLSSDFLCVAHEARAVVSRTMAMRDQWRTATHCILLEKGARLPPPCNRLIVIRLEFRFVRIVVWFPFLFCEGNEKFSFRKGNAN